MIVQQLPIGVSLDGCTVVRASKPNSIIFIRTGKGDIFHATRNKLGIDLTSEYQSTAADRSCYAKLAGIRVKEIEAARKQARLDAARQEETRKLSYLHKAAAKRGLKLVAA